MIGSVIGINLAKSGVQILQGIVKTHQDARAKVTDERVKEFTTPRPMESCVKQQ